MAFFETEMWNEHLLLEPEQTLFTAEEDKMQARTSSGSDGLSHYMRSMGGHKQLTREDEYELSRRAKKGDEAARRTLAVSNLPFVVAVAKKFTSRGARLDDLIQEGNVGLMKAIEHFDPKKNVRFATYAVWWIRAYITRYLKDNRSHVRGGEHERMSMNDFSLDTPMDDEGESTYMERLEDVGPTPDVTFLKLEQDEEVAAALQRVRRRLGDLGWDILQERLTQDKPRTLEELGQRWGVSRERVRQVELKTKNFLARYLETYGAENEATELSDFNAAA